MEENGVDNRQKAVGRNKNGPGAGFPSRLAETLQIVRDSQDLREAAKARGLVPSTVVKHLEELAEIGRLSSGDFAHLIPDYAADEIREALVADTSQRLAPVFHALGGRHSFETIRLVRLLRSQ